VANLVVRQMLSAAVQCENEAWRQYLRLPMGPEKRAALAAYRIAKERSDALEREAFPEFAAGEACDARR
jgi:hypothetical protein